ncbi:uncharacterized protein ACA1_392540 [Acanthamoeba castellanii str. Neff]|uniref:Uncharacterized protein n=1 Tax=Acanthamoeba castellanii (strain ATCC 30010 / Neff) TaxID=1257118 RepID=L8GP99_ACACF|nr:uncharacterized protein ACA1_392540 [Acanthamoeba castellanii str. Neff]ELR14810.1 hypothetical protein ACA1_392540 [Acanthamoeba castellanii str. Neff]
MSSPKRVAKRKRPVEDETEEVVEAPKAQTTTSKKTAGSPAKLKRENTMAAVVKEGGQFLDRAAGSPAKRASSRLATSAKPSSSSPRPAKRAKKTTKAAKGEEKKEEVAEEEEEEKEEEEEVEGKPVPQLVKGGSMLKVAKEAQHFLVKGSGSPMGKTRSQSAKAKQDESEAKKKKKPATPKKLVKQSTMADTAKEGAALLEKAGGSPATRLRPTKAAAKGKGKAAAKPAAKGKGKKSS